MLKSLLKLVWSSIIYPELKKLVQTTPNTIDDAALEFVNSQIQKIIDGLPI